MSTTGRHQGLWLLGLAAIAACSENATAPGAALNDAKTAPAPVLPVSASVVGDLMISSTALVTPALGRDGVIGSAIFGLPGRSLSGTVAPAGLGCVAADFTGFPVGRLALVERGVCTFSQKATNALAAGASGVIVYQSAASGDVLTVMGGDPVGIPAVFTGRTAGLTLVAAAPVGVTIDWNPFDPLAAVVAQLQTAGVLNDGVENSLITKLDNAKAKTSAGEDAVAINQLGAFTNEVDAMVKSKRLAESDGFILIITAKSIISTLTQ